MPRNPKADLFHRNGSIKKYGSFVVVAVIVVGVCTCSGYCGIYLAVIKMRVL